MKARVTLVPSVVAWGLGLAATGRRTMSRLLAALAVLALLSGPVASRAGDHAFSVASLNGSYAGIGTLGVTVNPPATETVADYRVNVARFTFDGNGNCTLSGGSSTRRHPVRRRG
jgi:hypothetical protein